MEGYELYLTASGLDKTKPATVANLQVMIGREALNILKTLKKRTVTERKR